MEAPDIIYILKDTPENEELRYSLRSLANLPHGKVVFVGGSPNGLVPDMHIKFDQEKDKKWDNAKNLIKKACENDSLTPNVYLFNDDFFVLKPVTKFPTFKNKTLEELAEHVTHKRTRYSEYISLRIDPTIEMLKEYNLPTVNYELHLPMLINRRKMLRIYEKFPTGAKRSCYGNSYKIGGEEIDPARMNDGSIHDPVNKIKEDRIFVSSTDESWVGVAGEQIRALFPTPSKYEI